MFGIIVETSELFTVSLLYSNLISDSAIHMMFTERFYRNVIKCFYSLLQYMYLGK